MYLLPKILPFFLLFSQLQAISPEEKPLSPIRIAFFLTRSVNITEEEFHNHWSTHHAPLVTPWLKRSGILEYNQVRLNVIELELATLTF
jgi:hypothetical protein